MFVVVTMGGSKFVTDDVTIGYSRDEVQLHMSGCAMFWRPFTNLSIWSGEYNRRHGAQNTCCHWHITGITSSQFIQYFSGHMHTLCAYFFHFFVFDLLHTVQRHLHVNYENLS